MFDPQQPFPSPAIPGGQEGPLGGLQDGVASVLNGADSHQTYVPGPDGWMFAYPRGRQPSVVRDMVLGAAAGFAGALVWRQMKRRHEVKGEFTSPGFRCLGLLVFPLLAGLALSFASPARSGAVPRHRAAGWHCPRCHLCGVPDRWRRALQHAEVRQPVPRRPHEAVKGRIDGK